MPGDVTSDAIGGAQLHATIADQVRQSMDDVHKQSTPIELQQSAEPGDEKFNHHLTEEFPSEEELITLRRVADRIPLKLFTIAFIEACERFSYYGTIIVYTNFIQWPLPEGSRTGAGGADGQSGALGKGQRASTGITTFNQFWQYCMPLLGAWVADEFWGRYKTITVALFIDILGHIILIMSAIPPVVTRPSSNSLAAMVIGILVIGFGTGGFKPNISPLIVEQLPLDRLRVKTLNSGERVIVDPAITINRVYNWFYMFINVGALIGQISMVYAEKYVGFWLSFLLPTSMLCICPLVMWWGRKRYERRPPGGSVLGKAVKTWFLAQKGRWHVNPYSTWRHMHDGTFWDNVKPSHFTPGTKPQWMTFDDAWVDELRRGFAACAVFLYFPIYWLSYNQLNNNLISQAAVMKLNGLPNDILTNLDPLALIIFIPICDFIVYPFLRRMKIKFTPIKKITAGFFTGAAAMVWATVIQVYIYRQSECGTHASGTTADGSQCEPVSINVWAQTGSYVLIALSEIFASITSLEYAFSKAPKNMRSMIQAVALFTTAISSAIGEAFVSLSADPLLVWNYGAMAVLAFVAGCVFWIEFRGLDREEDELNDLPEGKLFVEDLENTLSGPVKTDDKLEEEKKYHS
ncbi:Peptide transporter PTR2-A [Pleurostoma richardsiae]|uniref:Peptide transporter PTR2-A n=1 Tax=Pleurostoma richardsiae TaxID=41990 RepID=A0AA38RQX5_9PEZI|nr:Peptide transporter PTR2-A [Pleurostoma richardsiae]